MKTPITFHGLLAIVATVLLCSAAHAAENAVFTMDLPFDATHALPSWMHGPPVSAPGTGVRVAFPLTPPPDCDMLINLVFDGTEGGGLRVEWMRDGQNTTEVIAENLEEGLQVANQRSLLISASRLGGNGTLIVQGTAGLVVNRIKFEWVSEQTLLASSSRFVPVVATASRLTLGEADVDGGPRPVLRDEWRGRVVRAPLIEKAEALTTSIELVSTLESAPVQARIEAALAGVRLDQEVWLAVNGQELGPLAIEVPRLEDPGYLGRPGREEEFAGWRKASAHIPAALLLPGENTILLELRSPVNAHYRNRTYIREAVLELSYPAPRREPDLSLPVNDLPEATPQIEQAPPPAAPPRPTDALREFWSGEIPL